MLRVGLTGGIGSGKSTVAAVLVRHGAVVIDADQIAREVVAPGTAGLAEVLRRFGDTVSDGAGGLDRAALAKIVFADRGALKELEAITHPLIEAETERRFAAAASDAVVVHDMPLLVEKRLSAQYHLVVVVLADEELRVRRLVGSRGLDEADARARIRAQVTDAERIEAADVVLHNDATQDELTADVDALWDERIAPFAANVVAGVVSHRPSEVIIEESDPGWPSEAMRLLDRLGLVLGEMLLSADHIGSTAVPGLGAKDVLDLQLGVRDLADVDVTDVRARLAAAGFTAYPGEWGDKLLDGSQATKRLFGNADPGQVAHIHVREHGGPAWRLALLFRDWLRANDAARAEYDALKRDLAARVPGVDYSQHKDPWFEKVWARALAWEVESGWQPT